MTCLFQSDIRIRTIAVLWPDSCHIVGKAAFAEHVTDTYLNT
jgi:hypothetical protein